MEITEEYIERVYAAYIATMLKFYNTTPLMVIEKIEQHFEEDADSPLPVSLQPFRESVSLFENAISLSGKLNVFNDIYSEKMEVVRAKFRDMSEDEFVAYYREKRRKK